MCEYQWKDLIRWRLPYRTIWRFYCHILNWFQFLIKAHFIIVSKAIIFLFREFLDFS